MRELKNSEKEYLRADIIKGGSRISHFHREIKRLSDTLDLSARDTFQEGFRCVLQIRGLCSLPFHYLSMSFCSLSLSLGAPAVAYPSAR